MKIWRRAGHGAHHPIQNHPASPNTVVEDVGPKPLTLSPSTTNIRIRIQKRTARRHTAMASPISSRHRPHDSVLPPRQLSPPPPFSLALFRSFFRSFFAPAHPSHNQTGIWFGHPSTVRTPVPVRKCVNLTLESWFLCARVTNPGFWSLIYLLVAYCSLLLYVRPTAFVWWRLC